MKIWTGCAAELHNIALKTLNVRVYNEYTELWPEPTTAQPLSQGSAREVNSEPNIFFWRRLSSLSIKRSEIWGFLVGSIFVSEALSSINHLERGKQNKGIVIRLGNHFISSLAGSWIWSRLEEKKLLFQELLFLIRQRFASVRFFDALVIACGLARLNTLAPLWSLKLSIDGPVIVFASLQEMNLHEAYKLI